MSKRLLKYSFSLLHVDHVLLDRKWNYTNIISPYYRVYYIDEGEGVITNEKSRVKLEAGYLYIIPSFTLCNLNCPGFLSQYFIQFFEDSANGISLFHNRRRVIKVKAGESDIASVKRLLAINPGRGINRSDNPKVYEKSIYYKEYEELNNRCSVAVYVETQGILLQLLSRFLNSEEDDQVTASLPSKIFDAISYIQLNLHNELTVQQLAKRANQHTDYFSRQFLQFTGERPLAYIQTKRIERAQYLITTTGMSFPEIARETGFESLPHFSSVFKKLTQLTPGEYRKRAQMEY